VNVVRWSGSLLLVAALFVTTSCGKDKASRSSSEELGGSDDEVRDGAVAPMDEREAAQWAAARNGDPEELMRLVDLVGCFGLRDRAAVRDLRPTAIRAAAHCSDFSELPWLAQLSASKDDGEALAALEAIDELAARPRRATDPEDADELHTGCQGLLALARAPTQPRPRRVLAVRALRMLSEWGCVRREDLPKDLDVKN
jgi:hypothetical protein